MTSIFTDTFYSGDCIPITMKFLGPDNVTPMDLTGQTVGITIKWNTTDPDSKAIYAHDVPGDATGIINFIVPGYTGSNPTLAPPPLGQATVGYPFDVKRWNASGCRFNSVASNLIISQSTTARQSHT
jgi:hypothetical protein